jgi:uncharacterized membrane protein YfcA
MELILVCLVVAIGSIMTFFSGFGLGTLMLPVFALFLPLHIAVGATATIHLLNNLFKFILVYKHIHQATFLRFGVPAFLSAGLGAYCLSHLSNYKTPITFDLFTLPIQTSGLSITIGVIMFFFALFELIPKLASLQVAPSYFVLGGVLSGFFGGLSGHQGAFRSVFLARTNLSKSAFVATSNAIAIAVDLVRLTFYTTLFSFSQLTKHVELLIFSLLAALCGTFIGNKLLKKTTMNAIKLTIGWLLIVYSVFITFGITPS